VAQVIQRGNYTPLRVARKLKAMLAEPLFARRAEQVAQRLEQEDGVRSACDALEALYRSTQ
jgi:UDP:flavonoid glycosyltransferase YjiC (YdhE family)